MNIFWSLVHLLIIIISFQTGTDAETKFNDLDERKSYFKQNRQQQTTFSGPSFFKIRYLLAFLCFISV